MSDEGKLDLEPLRRTLASLEDGLEVVSEPQWFQQQTSKVQKP